MLDSGPYGDEAGSQGTWLQGLWGLGTNAISVVGESRAQVISGLVPMELGPRCSGYKAQGVLGLVLVYWWTGLGVGPSSGSQPADG